MAFGTRIKVEPIRELDFGDLSGTYVPLGSPTTNHGRIIDFVSTLNQEIYISFDGINNHYRMAMNSFKLLDLTTNKVRDDGLFLAAGTQVYVKEVSASTTSGSVWLELTYAEGGV
jgi:hypothetical protein